MEPILMIILVLMLMLIGLIIFNSKFDISMLTLTWLIIGISFISILLLTVIYNSHQECYNLINHNNVTLELIQNTCYQYTNI